MNGDTLAIIAIVAVLALFGSMFWCLKHEAKVGGIYKELHIFGRIYSYFAVSLIFGVIALLLFGILDALGVFPTYSGASPDQTQAILTCVIGGVAGILMYWRVYKKTPEALKKRCLFDLTISGLASALKVSS